MIAHTSQHDYAPHHSEIEEGSIQLCLGKGLSVETNTSHGKPLVRAGPQPAFQCCMHTETLGKG